MIGISAAQLLEEKLWEEAEGAAEGARGGQREEAAGGSKLPSSLSRMSAFASETLLSKTTRGGAWKQLAAFRADFNANTISWK
jgi:hypothetical protein